MSGINAVSILTYVLAVALGFFIDYFINKLKISKANVSATKIIDEATVKADNLVKEAILDAKTEAYELKLLAEKEAKQQRQEINELENKLYVLPEELNTEIAALKLQAMGVGIDKLTQEQETYLHQA